MPNRFALINSRYTRASMTPSSGVTSAAVIANWYFGANTGPREFLCQAIEATNAIDTPQGPKDLFVGIAEAASASDVRSFGTFPVTSPGLTFDSRWDFDTLTPDGSTRAHNNAAVASVTFSCYNVPSMTVTVQKEYGWGIANVFVDNIQVATITSHDEDGGGFLQDVVVPLNITGAVAKTVRMTTTSVSKPFVFTGLRLNTEFASPDATVASQPPGVSDFFVTEIANAADVAFGRPSYPAAVAEQALASEGVGIAYLTGTVEFAPADMSCVGVALFNSFAIEVGMPNAAQVASAQFCVTRTEVLRAMSGSGDALYAAAVEACVAGHGQGVSLSPVSEVDPRPSPFLTNIPAVFRIVAVRKVGDKEVESTPTKRLWARVEKTSQGNVPGDVFVKPGQRLFPRSDFVALTPM